MEKKNQDTFRPDATFREMTSAEMCDHHEELGYRRGYHQATALLIQFLLESNLLHDKNAEELLKELERILSSWRHTYGTRVRVEKAYAQYTSEWTYPPMSLYLPPELHVLKNSPGHQLKDALHYLKNYTTQLKKYKNDRS